MPPSADSTGRRKVRCPKCTALLTEPKTQIYECPKCSTLLLAKRSFEDVYQCLDGGSKLEKAGFVDESWEKHQMVANEKAHLSSDGKSFRSGPFHANTEVPSKMTLNSGYRISHVPCERGEPGHSFAGLDSESQAEVGADNGIGERVQTGFSSVNRPQASSCPGSPGRHFINAPAGQSMVIVGNDDALGRQEKSELETGFEFHPWSGNGKKNECASTHQIGSPQEVADEQFSKREVDAQVQIGNQLNSGSVGSRDMKSSQCHNAEKDASVGECRHPPLDEQKDTVVLQKSRPAKFRLFDLSVFGIYDEETYTQLSQAKEAQYPGLCSNGSSGGGLQRGISGGEMVSNEHYDVFHPQVEGGSGDGVPKDNTEGAAPTLSIDELANARYGDILAERNLAPYSIEISLSDWQSQRVVKPSQKALDVAGGVPIHEQRMPSPDTEDSAESSWDDEDEGVTTSSTLTKEVSNFQGEPASPGTRRTSQGEGSLEEPGFPLRTTAMQKFLQNRNIQEPTVETQEDSELYEAPYVEHYSPPQQGHSEQDVDQGKALFNASRIEKVGSQGSAAKEALERDRIAFEAQCGYTHDSHPLLAPSVDVRAMSQISLRREGEALPDVQSVRREDLLSNEAELVDGIPSDAPITIMDQMGIPVSSKAADFRHLPANDGGNVPEKPISLRWKGKAGSTSTQSLSSMEDETGYTTESNTASGSERDFALKQEAGSSEGLLPFNKESKIGSGESVRSHYQPVAGVSRRTRVSNAGLDGEKYGSGEIGAPRSARTRASNQRLVNADALEQGRAAFAWSGPLDVHRGHKPVGWHGQASNLNKNSFDTHLSHSHGVPHGYNSDRSYESNEGTSHFNYSERPLIDPFGLSVASGGPYPLPLPPHGAVSQTSLQEHGFTHSCHHGASPACSLCMQQQYNLQQQQKLHWNMMLHSCPACVSQSPAAAYESTHHDMHAHHVHPSGYLNPLLRLNESAPHSLMQNVSNTGCNHLVASLQKAKLYPPLPGKGAAPFVICKNCDHLVQVPALPPTTGPIQKLQCGKCQKVCKYSAHARAGASSGIGEATASFVMDAPHMQKVLDIDKRSVHSSSFDPGYGLSTSSRNVYGVARHVSDRASQHEWDESRMFTQPNSDGIFKMGGENFNPQKLARRTGGMPEQGRGRIQPGHEEEDDHLYENSGTKSEVSLSPSHSSASGSSLVRYGQIMGGQQQGLPHMKRSSGFGDGRESPDFPARQTMYEEDRSRASLETGGGGTRSPVEHIWKASTAPGSPLIEHFGEDAIDFGFGSSAPLSPTLGSPLLDPFMSADSDESSHVRERELLPGQDLNKKPKFFASLLKISIGKRGQGRTKGRVVWINGHLITEAAVRRAEELAGSIHPGSYWYDYQAGFWGAMGGPCLGILVPCIEEFNFPLARDCAGGKTGILVNGRELHEKDLEVLVKRGLPNMPGKAYILDISGVLIDDVTGRPLKDLGKLAPSIERRGRGFGMSLTQIAAPS